MVDPNICFDNIDIFSLSALVLCIEVEQSFYIDRIVRSFNKIYFLFIVDLTVRTFDDVIKGLFITTFTPGQKISDEIGSSDIFPYHECPLRQ